MSANHFVAESKFVFFISQLLNISIEDETIVIDIENTLREIVDIPAFIEFVKERFNYSAYEFKTGYQKFVALARDFRRENPLRLDNETEGKVDKFSNHLYGKSVHFFEFVRDLIQTASMNLTDTKIKIFYETYFKEERERAVLSEVGNLKELYNYAINSKQEFESLIFQIVTRKALINKYPQLANNKKEFEGMGTIERLKYKQLGSGK